MSTKFYTADTHFLHAAMPASGKGWRPFATVEEMNELFIERWNSVVTKRDIVYHLGDVGVGRDHDILECVRRLNGTKRLILGNHDAPFPGNGKYSTHTRRWTEPGLFESLASFATGKIDRTPVMLSHFPYEGDHTGEDRFDQFRLRDNGAVLLHGHVHGAWADKDRQINVGVDVRDWRPVAIDEVVQIIRRKGLVDRT